MDHVGEPGQRSLRPTIEIFVLVSVRLYRDGITDALRQDRRFDVVGSSPSLEAARVTLDALPEAPVVALVDLDLAEGVYAVRALRSAWPATTIVALAVREVDEDVVAWVEAGVSGLVSREATLAELLDAVEAASHDQVIATPGVTGALLRRVASLAGQSATNGGPELTRRERQVVRLIGDGLSNKEIASALQIELPTVKNHVHNILEKLSVARRSQAVAAARERGYLERI